METYVQAASQRTGAPIHIVREFGESMVVITECGKQLSFPLFADEPGEPYVCQTCWRKVNWNG